MISSLHIENVAVIRSCDIEFSPGFNVLTGETGAGKSMLIDSIGIIMGEKPQKELLRRGEEKAVIDAVLTDLPQRVSDLTDGDGELIVSRSFDANGKANAKMNGRPVSASVLRESMGKMVSVHGQNDSLGLLSPSLHLEYIDSYGSCASLRAKYAEEYEKLTAVRREMEELTKDEREKARLCDLYKMQLDDIDGAKLKDGEEEELNSRLEMLKNSEKIVKHAQFIVKTLYRSEKGVPASELIRRAASSVEAISEYFPEPQKYIDSLNEMSYKLEEIALIADDIADVGCDNPDAEMDRIQSRLDRISKLERKYGATVAEVLAYRNDIASKYENMANSEQLLGELSKKEAELERAADAAGKALSERRRAAGDELESRIISELSYLEMPKVRFKADVRRSVGDDGRTLFRPDGTDCVEFLFSANPGEDLMPLSKVASGGELARVMLALRTVNLGGTRGETLIFDEIDTGVSGKTSHKIGMRLHDIAKTNQVICVTHSAQIAAEADRHFRISKTEVNGRTETSVTELDGKGRVSELSRIMGGVKITEKIVQSAEEMLSDAEKRRNTF